jgi:hypothetical protein
MATYKVIQDIEAEDHILGPLSLRQFIYALVAAFCLYMSFIGLTKHFWPLLIAFLPVALLAGFFAFPFGKDQPTEVWALAKIRFIFKPRRRIWNQSGVKELVTVTVPKKIELQLTNGLDQTEVKSRLAALASTIDSRGWAIKNAGGGGYAQPSMLAVGSDSDRLVSIGSIPQPVPDYDVLASDDMLDERASPIAQQFTQMIDTSAQNHRQQIVNELSGNGPATAADPQWFAHPPLGSPQPAAPVTTPTADEAAVVAKLDQQQAAAAQANANLHTLKPTAAPADQPAPPPATASPAAPDPAILKLANNNDHSVATLAREAGQVKDLDGSDGEVVIALH